MASLAPGRLTDYDGPEREFWKKVAGGVSSEDAVCSVQVSAAGGSCWFRRCWSIHEAIYQVLSTAGAEGWRADIAGDIWRQN